MDAEDVRAMQSLAATAWRLRPETVNIDATVGELAWVWGHRRAWTGSTLSVEIFERVMATWPYRAELDAGVRAPDGTIVARATAWMDDANGTVELEPVGTDEAHRQRGLGRAVNLFALQRAKAAGATTAIVGCRGDDDYPIPRRLYWAIGFEPIARDVAYVRAF